MNGVVFPNALRNNNMSIPIKRERIVITIELNHQIWDELVCMDVSLAPKETVEQIDLLSIQMIRLIFNVKAHLPAITGTKKYDSIGLYQINKYNARLLMKNSYYNIIQWMDLALHPLR
ncbi:hypothetical protein ACJX0J_032301, partial [Zea mays]